MMDICASIALHVGELFSCETVGEFTRVQSPLMYPDGDYIDVYVKDGDGRFVVTDLGETSRWLKMQTTALHRSRRQNSLILDACETHGVEWYRGMVTARAGSVGEIPASILRVAQAALRISDLWFTLRSKTVDSIAEDIEAALIEKQIPYDRNVKLSGRSQKAWRVDFQARGATRSSLVEVLSTGNRAVGQTMVQHAVAIWYDLSYLTTSREAVRFITLIDDTTDVWTAEDIRLVEDLSDIAFWSRQEEFLETLAA